MSDPLPPAGEPAVQPRWLRIFVILIVGLCALNVVQYFVRAMDERLMLTMNPHGFLKRVK
jgi:hypothetical protein